MWVSLRNALGMRSRTLDDPNRESLWRRQCFAKIAFGVLGKIRFVGYWTVTSLMAMISTAYYNTGTAKISRF